MRHVIGLFDAPAPAAASLVDLQDAGFDDADVAVAPSSAAANLRPGMPYRDLQDGEAALSAALGALGVRRAEAASYSQAVSRGAILVVVRVPALSVPLAAAALQVPGALDLVRHQARLQADPDLAYGWDLDQEAEG